MKGSSTSKSKMEMWYGELRIIFTCISDKKEFLFTMINWFEKDPRSSTKTHQVYKKTEKYDVISLTDVELMLCHFIPIPENKMILNTFVHYNSPLLKVIFIFNHIYLFIFHAL